MSYLDLISNLQSRRVDKKAQKKHIDGSLDCLKRWGATIVTSEYIPVTETTSTTNLSTEKTLLDNPYDESIWESPDRFLHFVQRDLNILEESPDPRIRRSCIKKIHDLIVLNKEQVSTFIADHVFLAVRRPLLKAFSDDIDEVREMAAKIVSVFISVLTDVEEHMRLVFPVLISRLGIVGMDGLVYLPEDALNKETEQLPQELRPVEESEEVRLEFYRTAWAAIDRFDETLAVSFSDEAAGLLRAACMDPHSVIKEFGCECLVEFVRRFDRVMYHYSVTLARGASSCLVHNHARIRMSGVDVVTAAMKAGMFKYSAFIIEHMVGYYDPNVVPIKAFYEYHTQMNYFAKLTHDRSHAVRRHVHETIGLWLATHGDRMDYEGKVAPYLLSGLFDEVPASQWYAMALLERVGVTYGEQQEKDLKELRQYGVASPWSYNGAARFSFPLGARLRLPENPLLYLCPGASEDEEIKNQSFTQLATSIRQYTVEKYCSIMENGASMATEGFASSLQGIEKSSIMKELFGDSDPMSFVRCDSVLFEKDCKKGDVDFNIAALPSLEVRIFVRSVARRFIKALLHEVTEFKELTTSVSANLLMVLLPFVEENATEYLDASIALNLKILSPNRSAPPSSKKLYSDVLRLFGVLTLPRAWWKIVKAHVTEGVSEDNKWTSLLILARLLSGATAVLRDVRERNPNIESLIKPVLSDIVNTLADCAPEVLVAPPYAALWMYACLAELAQPEVAKDLTFSDVGRLVATTLCVSAGSYVPGTLQSATGASLEGSVTHVIGSWHVSNLIDHWAYYGPKSTSTADENRDKDEEGWTGRAESLVSDSISTALSSDHQTSPALIAALLKVAPLHILSNCHVALVECVRNFCSPMNPPSARAAIRSAASELLRRANSAAQNTELLGSLETIRSLATDVAVAALVPPLKRDTATSEIVGAVKVWHSRDIESGLASHLLKSGAAEALASLCAAHELPQKLFWLQVVEYWQKTNIPHQAELAENELDIPSAARAKIRNMSSVKAAEARTGAALALNTMLLSVREGNVSINGNTLKNIWMSLRKVLHSPEKAREQLEGPLEEQLRDLCVASAANPVHFQDEVEKKEEQKEDTSAEEKIVEIQEETRPENSMIQELEVPAEKVLSYEEERRARVQASVRLLKTVMHIEKRELRQRSMPFRRVSAETLIVVVATLRLFFLPIYTNPHPMVDNMALVRLSTFVPFQESALKHALAAQSSISEDQLWFKKAELGDSDLVFMIEELLDHFMELDPPSLPPVYQPNTNIAVPSSNAFDVTDGNYEDFVAFFGHPSISNDSRIKAGTELLNSASDSMTNNNTKSEIRETALLEVYKLLSEMCLTKPAIFLTRQHFWEKEGRVKRAKVFSDLVRRVADAKK
eukprot:GDKJ01017934.1.p1 GENE.GDKJ01017934.1~~GDKJ01017934.1.p1  ORF type:complete len:1387 (-),score=346.21 GDKJ01017934.1:74-4234(-)